MARHDLQAEREELRKLAAEGGLECPRCRYDLTGLNSNWCPECGKLLRPRWFTEPVKRSFQFDIDGRLVLLAAFPLIYLFWTTLAILYGPTPRYAFSPGNSGILASRTLMQHLGWLIWSLLLFVPAWLRHSRRQDRWMDRILVWTLSCVGWVFVGLQSLGLLLVLIL